jgi:hypothetical protein
VASFFFPRAPEQVSDEEGPNSLGYFISRQNDIILGGTAIKGIAVLTVVVVVAAGGGWW